MVQVLFIPKYCCWLNLIEPWWKQLRSLALKGRRFETVAEIIDAVAKATEYWNKHRYPYIWKKVSDGSAQRFQRTSHLAKSNGFLYQSLRLDRQISEV
jgi:hypothetical protein